MGCAEYSHLLQTARVLDKEKVYLLGCRCGKKEYTWIVTVPGCLKKELLDYAQKNSIFSGPIFQTRDGRPMHRTYISAAIRSLCEEAKITEDKGNLKRLRKLYLSTRAGVESNISLLVEQFMERMVKQEQFHMGREDV